MKKITTLLIVSCIASSTLAQILPQCTNGPVFVDNCVSACLSCNFQVPFNINNASFTLDDPQDDCLLMHNNMWFAFMAFESSVTFSAIPSNCDQPEGIQIAVYGGCEGPCLFSDYGCHFFPVSVTATGLDIGTIYYVIIDGCDGAVCDIQFNIDPLSAVTEPEPNASDPLQGPSDVCTNGTFTYCIEPVLGAFRYEWHAPAGVLVNGMAGPIVYLPAPDGHCAEITFGPTTGSREICVRSLGCYQSMLRCATVTVTELPETVLPPIVVCPEEAVGYALPWGAYINPSPGTKDYQHKFSSEHGCDSIVKIAVTIPPPITTNLHVQYLCPGECIMVGGASYCLPGTYLVKLSSHLGCDSNIVFSISQINLNAHITQSDTLSCNTSIITLNSSAQPNVIKAWTNASGQVLGTADTLMVTQPGMYYLSVTSNQNNFSCTRIDSVAIKKDTLAPSISLSADTLGCAANPALIRVTTDSIPAAYFWNGPGNFSASVADTFVVLTGLYSVTVTNLENGCTNSASINVPINFIPPDVVLDTSAQIDCQHPFVSLNAHSMNAVAFEWTGPNGFISQLQQPQVDTAGIYTVTVKDTSGCINSASITVNENLLPPVISVVGDTVSCTQPIGVIQAFIQTGAATFEWSGPGGFTAFVPNPSVDSVGDYQVIATGTNGCSAVAAVTVVADLGVPGIMVSGGMLSCLVTKTTVHCDSDLPGLQVSWTGPGGFQSNLATDSVSLPGAYTATVFGTNGCTSTAAVMVIADVAVPDIYAVGDTLTCANSTVLLNGESTTPGASFKWSGPLNFSAAVEDAFIGTPGLYSLSVTDPVNGCIALTTLFIEQDTISPPVTATAGVITCANTTALLQGISPATDLVWQWTGPGNFASTDQIAVADTVGVYSLLVTKLSNGCTAIVTAIVQTDLTPPLINISGADTLTCSMTTLILTGSSNEPVQWQWVLPGGSSFDTAEIAVQMPGGYTLTATGSNGCTLSATVNIAQDTIPPDLSASGDTLDCFGGLAMLAGQSLTPGVSWSWTGPGNFTSVLQTPSTSVSGVYSLSALAPNGCETTVTATVSENNALPQVVLSGMDVLSCSDSTLTLLASITVNATGQWNTGDTDTVLTVIAPGIYSFTAVGTNGCSKTATIEIVQDIEPPANVHASEGQINCNTPVISLYGTSSTPNVAWSWTGPANFFSTAQNPGNIAAPGVYTLTVLNTGNGCTASTTSTVTADNTTPVASVVADTITCLAQQVQMETSSIFDILSYHWTGPGNFSIDQEDPWVNLPGLYQLVVTATNGCTGTVELNLIQDTIPPGASAVGDTLSCNTPTGALTGISPTSGAIYMWNGPNNFQSSDPSPIINQPGAYSLLVTGMNGCSSTAQAVVTPDFAQPSLVAGGGILTCNVSEIMLTALTTLGGSWLWNGPDNFQSTLQNPATNQPGVYTVTTTGANGCTASASSVVLADTLAPAFSIATPALFNCNTTEIGLNATIQNPLQYNAQWNTPNGHLTNGANSAQAFADLPGLYTLVVTDVQNGCSASQSVTVLAESNMPTALILKYQDITCFGYNDGVISIDSVIGGTMPIVFSVDGGDYSATLEYENLTPGSHTVQLLDASGCTLEAITTLNEPDLLRVTLGPDTLLEIGNPIALFVLSAVSEPQRVIEFTTTPLMLQGDTVLYPLQSFVYSLWVRDAHNCTASDEQIIQVDHHRKVYIPNVFRPDIHGDNAVLTVYGGPDVHRIKTFRIYDRWGELVHNPAAFTPNDLSGAWDGRVNGKSATPGVFVYYVEIEFIDGESGIFKGDVTVVR